MRSGMTCWRRLRDWQAAGVWEKIWRVLLDELGLATRSTGRGGNRQLLRYERFLGGENRSNPPIAAKMARSGMLPAMVRGYRWPLRTTGANVHDSQVAVPLIDAIPPIKRPGGGRRNARQSIRRSRLRCRREDSRALRRRGIHRSSLKRNTEHGSGLGVHRCVVEWSLVGCSNFAAFAYVTKNGPTSTRLPHDRCLPHLLEPIGRVLLEFLRPSQNDYAKMPAITAIQTGSTARSQRCSLETPFIFGLLDKWWERVPSMRT